MLDKLSKGKALSSLPYPDEHLHYLREIGHTHILNNLWKPQFLRRYPEIFSSRLIPLNKIHPNLPNKTQMRPIVVTSALFKVLELRFADELRDAFDKLPPLYHMAK